MKYTFEDLRKMSSAEIAEVKKEQLDSLCKLQQKQWTDIAAILFYQEEIIKGEAK